MGHKNRMNVKSNVLVTKLNVVQQDLIFRKKKPPKKTKICFLVTLKLSFFSNLFAFCLVLYFDIEHILIMLIENYPSAITFLEKYLCGYHLVV